MPYAKIPARLLAVSLALLAGGYTTETLADGKLDHIGQQVRRDAPPSRPSSGSDTSCCSRPTGSRELNHALGQLFAYIVFSPWLLPNYALEDGRPRDAAYRVRFADYPYADHAPGYLSETPSWTVASTDDGIVLGEQAPRSAQSVAAQLAVETGYAAGIIRNGFVGRLQFPMRLELDTDWSIYRELDLDGVDTTWLGREHLSVRFAESRSLQFRTGFGPQHLRDTLGWVHGFDVTWGFEAFPGRPFVVAFEGSAGLLGKAFAAGVSGRIGVMQGPFEVALGWHQRWIADTPLGAPFLAVRLWL